MDRLNYQHLFYFWNVVREGSVTGASEKLKLAQPTISGQLTTFESAIGAQLLKKQGRRLILTETGRIVFNYAEEIFSLGFELTSTLKAQGGTHGRRLSVGISDALPKLIVYRLIEPVLETFKDTVVVCREDRTDRLLAELALHGIDLLISDGPATSSVGIRIHNHFLGESDVGIFGAPSLVAQFSNDFPKSLEGAPFLLPTQNTALRRSLDSWFELAAYTPGNSCRNRRQRVAEDICGRRPGIFRGSNLGSARNSAAISNRTNWRPRWCRRKILRHQRSQKS